jgi:hypothetical protein
MGIFSFLRRAKSEKIFINELSVQTIEAGLSCSECLHPQKGSNPLEIYLEFIYFYLHIISRICLYKHDAEKRKKLILSLLPVTFANVLDVVARDRNLSAKTKKAMYDGFVDSYLTKDVVYSLCTIELPKNPLDRTSLFSKIAELAITTAQHPTDDIELNEIIIQVAYREVKNRIWEEYISLAVEKI